MNRKDEHGFSLVEALVAIFLLSVLSVGFYQVMFSAVRGSNDTADIAQVAAEARLGFNRMIRDTRETTSLIVATDTSYRIWVDFDRDGCVDAGTAFNSTAAGGCVSGGTTDYEYLEFEYDDPDLTLMALQGPNTGLKAAINPNASAVSGTGAETLASSIDEVAGKDIFTYVSNFLEFDANDNGETSATELETAITGTSDGVLSGLELDYISDVNYAFRVVVNGDSRTFYGQASIRNRRYSDL